MKRRERYKFRRGDILQVIKHEIPECIGHLVLVIRYRCPRVLVQYYKNNRAWMPYQNYRKVGRL